MDKYKQVSELINTKTDWTDDEEFTFDLIAKANINLIYYCNKQIEQNNYSQIIPNLRNIQENIIRMVSLHEKIKTEEVLSGKFNAEKAFDKIKSFLQEQDEIMKINCVSDFLKNLKEILNEFSHTTASGILHLAFTELQTAQTHRINRIPVKVLLYSLENIFISAVNTHYGLTVPTTEKSSIHSEIAQSRTYERPKLPPNIKKYMTKSACYKKHEEQQKKFLNDMRDELENMGKLIGGMNYAKDN